MFEAVNDIPPKVRGNNAFPAQVVPLKTPEPAGGQKTLEKATLPAEQSAQVAQEAEDRVTEEMLSELERDIETIHSIGLRFSKHDESGRTMIKVMDKQSHELIREIPSEEVLNLVAKIDEMIGILFDKKV